MADDWDLLAVVRGCSAASSSDIHTTTTTAITTASCSSSSSNSSSFRLDFCSQSPSSSFSPYGLEQVSRFFGLSSSPAVADPMDSIRRNPIGDQLHELYKPFFPRSHHSLALPPPPPTTNASSASSISPPFPAEPTPPSFLLRHQQLLKRPLPSSAAPNSSRSKRRKTQVKKVCQVPAEALSADVWAWRKYGQKPIKGSPYPRGYYRCSTSKACMARKQVERNRSDPGMFIVTYTAEHSHPAPSHRNSLAGTTRQKSSPSPTTPPQGNDESEKPCPDSKPSCSSPMTPAEEDDQLQSTAVESREVDLDVVDEDDDELGNCSGDAPDDDFFMGLEELTSLAAGDCFSVPFPTGFAFPRLATAGRV